MNVETLPELSEEVAEAEWEEGWIMESETLTQCYKENSPYSACPNMGRGKRDRLRRCPRIFVPIKIFRYSLVIQCCLFRLATNRVCQ